MASSWAVYGLAGVWELLAPSTSTSTGSPPVTVTNRKLISPTGFILFNTIVKQ